MPWELFAFFWSCQLLLICGKLLYKMLPQLQNQIWFSFGNWPQTLITIWVVCCAMLFCTIWFEDKRVPAGGQRGFKKDLRLNALCAGLAGTRWGWLGATMCTHNMSTTCAFRLRCCDASCASPSGWFGYVCGMLLCKIWLVWYTWALRCWYRRLGKTSIEKKRFLSGIARMRGGVYPCPDFWPPFFAK